LNVSSARRSPARFLLPLFVSFIQYCLSHVNLFWISDKLTTVQMSALDSLRRITWNDKRAVARSRAWHSWDQYRKKANSPSFGLPFTSIFGHLMWFSHQFIPFSHYFMPFCHHFMQECHHLLTLSRHLMPFCGRLRPFSVVSGHFFISFSHHFIKFSDYLLPFCY
jgi:hypothetical protein